MTLTAALEFITKDDGAPRDGGQVLAKLQQFERDIAEFKAIIRELRHLRLRQFDTLGAPELARVTS